jgi:8-oxo-dGTP pyrophosphatase MutT (NUDIX family)
MEGTGEEEEEIAAALSRRPGVPITDPKFRSIPRAAVAMILRRDPVTRELVALLVKRVRKERDPWSGQMALPGGRAQASDSDIFATAKREVLEETSIDLTKCRVLGRLDDVMPRSTGSIIVTPFVVSAQGSVPPVKVKEDEIATFVWVPLSFFWRRKNQSERLVVLEGDRTLRVPAYLVLGEHVVWGLTFRILQDLRKRLQEQSAGARAPGGSSS